MKTDGTSALYLPPDYPIHNEHADRAVRFINGLTHTKGRHAKKGFALRPWQENKIIRPIFGRVDENGLRLIRKSFIGLPRKQGKSEICAAIALKLLCSDGEHGGQIYSAASDRDQAALVFNVAKGMVLNDPKLSQRCKIIDSQKRIVYLPTDSFYRAISSDANTKHGFDTSGVVYDELHTARDRELWDVLTTSTGSREQPLIVAITTAGYDKETICGEQWEYAWDVQRGLIIDPSYHPVIFSAPEGADWQDRELWHAINPALGDFRSLKEMEDMALLAARIPAQQNAFRRLYLNQWTAQEHRWIPLEEWLPCGVNLTQIEFEKILLGRPCYVGVDLSSKKDITAVVLVFPFDDGSYWILPYFYMPEAGINENDKKNKAQYHGWVTSGHMRVTPGNIVDQNVIESHIKNEFGTKFNIKEIAIDRWNSTQMQIHLSEHGFTVVPYGQGFKDMTAPAKEWETLTLTRKIVHNNNAVMNWMIDNVAVVSDDAGNLKPSKKQSKKKIDGVVAGIMGLGRALVRPEEKPSVYEDRGMIIL